MCKTQNTKMTGKLLVLADTYSRSLVNKLRYESARHGCNARTKMPLTINEDMI